MNAVVIGVAAVACLFGGIMADDAVRASGATRGLLTDDKVAIVLKPTELLLGSCPKRPGSIMHVRLQSLKTKSGTIFRRKAITDDEFACLAASSSQPLAAGNIVECSEKAVVAGLKMFRWDGGNCTGYTNGIPVNIARCAGAGSVVLYSVDVQTESPVVSNITFAFSNSSTIDATWDVTSKSCFVAYRVSFNNNNTTVSDKFATVGSGTVSPCAEYPLTVTPVDANSAVMGPAATVKVVMPKAREVSFNLTHGVTAVKASWSVEYTCNPNKQPTMIVPIASYSVTLGNQTVTTNHSTFEFTFDKDMRRCTNSASTLTANLNVVTFMALDDTGAQVLNVTATLTDNTMPGRRYYSDKNNNCMFYQKLEETPGGVGVTFDQVQDFCQKTMFSQMFIGAVSMAAFLEEIALWEVVTSTVFATPFFLGLKRNSTSGKWMWLKGHEMQVGDTDWDDDEPSSAGECAELKYNLKMAALSCNAPNRTIVCYDYLA